MKLSQGLKIRNIEHKDWEDWRVLRKYDEGTWEIRGESGDRVLFENEAHFWETI